MNIIKAVWISEDIDNENKDGSWIPLGYVYAENPVDSSDLASLKMDYKNGVLEIVELVDNNAFTHIVKDTLGNFFAVIIGVEE